MSENEREITCIYNGNDNEDKQTLGYLSATDKKVLSIDISKQKLTGTQWIDLGKRLNLNLNQLIDPKKIEGNIDSFSNHDCTKILRENPDALNGAIVFTKGKAKQIKNPSKVLTFIDSDSEGIQKT
ncbi:hypothetical protein [uncultured Winogradskyella sp.]|uniref:hypothetical protein n=1 Tax=Winogradskyella sp. 4-2091 TaxID=3381659 RepID=UPI002639D8AE|nr:hypothetical protein [uncultured Winogradskyella sp.]